MLSADPDNAQLRADEREVAMIRALYELSYQARLYAALYRQAHPVASDEQCYRAPLNAVRYSGDTHAAFWCILRERVNRTLARACGGLWEYGA